MKTDIIWSYRDSQTEGRKKGVGGEREGGRGDEDTDK